MSLKMSKLGHISGRVSAVVAGLVLFVAGVFKLMDPVGTGLIVSSYLQFLHLGFLQGIAAVTGGVLALAETAVGGMLVCGIFRRKVALASVILMAFFTLLTVILVIFNPEMDCGCFGEVVHLTHWQSLLKNLVLLSLVLLAFWSSADGFVARKSKGWAFAAVMLCTAAFAAWSLRELPVLDFTIFAPGVQLMSAADGEGADDSALLSFCDAYGEYCDELAVQGSVLIFSVGRPDRLDSSDWEKLQTGASSALAMGIRPIVLLPSTDAAPLEMGEYSYSADMRTILALNRSNAGATFVSDGVIVRKWPFSSCPDEDELDVLQSSDPLEVIAHHTVVGRIFLQAYLLSAAALLLLL